MSESTGGWVTGEPTPHNTMMQAPMTIAFYYNELIDKLADVDAAGEHKITVAAELAKACATDYAACRNEFVGNRIADALESVAAAIEHLDKEDA